MLSPDLLPEGYIGKSPKSRRRYVIWAAGPLAAQAESHALVRAAPQMALYSFLELCAEKAFRSDEKHEDDDQEGKGVFEGDGHEPSCQAL